MIVITPTCFSIDPTWFPPARGGNVVVAGWGHESALGASTMEQIQKCIETGAEGDLDSKAGREKAFTDTAKCSANAYCASLGIPPETEICATIAGEVAEFVIDAWNDVFGNQDEWEAHNQRLKSGAGLRAQHDQSDALAGYMQRALMLEATKLAEIWESADTTMRGKLGTWTEFSPSDRSFLDDPEWQSRVLAGNRRVLLAQSPSLVYALLNTNGVELRVQAQAYQAPDPRLECGGHFPSREARIQCLYDWTKRRALPWLAALQHAVPRVTDAIVAASTKAQTERAAANRKKWEASMAANRKIDEGDYEGAKEIMRGDLPPQALDPYAVAANRGRSRTLLLNGGLLVGGATLIGAAWYLGRRRH